MSIALIIPCDQGGHQQGSYHHFHHHFAICLLHPYWSLLLNYKLYHFIKKDRVERHDFWPRVWLFFPLFSSLLKKEGRRKGEWIAKFVIKSHAFLLDPSEVTLWNFVGLNYIVSKSFSIKFRKRAMICHKKGILFILIDFLCNTIQMTNYIISIRRIEQKDMTFDHEFGYSFPFSLPS